MNLYLVEFSLWGVSYPDDQWKSKPTMRLVKADNEGQARQKVKDRFEYSSEGGDSTYVDIIEVYETIE